MKIKNENIFIQIGEKKVNIHNYINDVYLKAFMSRQFDFLTFKTLKYIFIRFDTPLPNRTIKANDFTYFCRLLDDQVIEKGEKNHVTMVYNFFNIKELAKFDESVGAYSVSDLNSFVGHKITALGFGTTDYEQLYDDDIEAYVDISSLNIYVEKDKDINIVRTDSIDTNLLFYSNDVNYAVHLSALDNKSGYIVGAGFTNYIEDNGVYMDLDTVGDIVESLEHEINLSDIQLELESPLKSYIGYTHLNTFLAHVTKTKYKYFYLKYRVYENSVTSDGDKISTPTNKYYKMYSKYDDDFEYAKVKIQVKRG